MENSDWVNFNVLALDLFHAGVVFVFINNTFDWAEAIPQYISNNYSREGY